MSNITYITHLPLGIDDRIFQEVQSEMAHTPTMPVDQTQPENPALEILESARSPRLFPAMQYCPVIA